MTPTTKLWLYNNLLAKDRLRYPNVPDAARDIRIYPDTNEKGIKKNVKQLCEFIGIKCIITDSKAKKHVRVNKIQLPNGNYREVTVTKYIKSGLSKGHHDCELSRNNRLYSVEIKAQNEKTKYKDRQSEVQKAWQFKMKDEYGNDYYIVRGMDDIKDLILNEILPNS